MNILAVDDIVVIRKMVGQAAQSLDATVFEASNGEEALQVLTKMGGKIDLIFLDWNMPKMNGIEFLTHIKKTPQYKDIPVVMTTTVNERENIIKAIQAGAAQYMVKPFTKEDVIKKIMERIDVSASLRFMFLIKTKELIASITELEVEEKDGNPVSDDDGCEFFGQMLITGQHRILIIYSMTKNAVGRLVGWKTGSKADQIEDKLMLKEFNKFMRVVAKGCLENTRGQGHGVPFVYSSFVTEKQPLLAAGGSSIIAKMYAAEDVKMTVTTCIV